MSGEKNQNLITRKGTAYAQIGLTVDVYIGIFIVGWYKLIL